MLVTPPHMAILIESAVAGDLLMARALRIVAYETIDTYEWSTTQKQATKTALTDFSSHA